MLQHLHCHGTKYRDAQGTARQQRWFQSVMADFKDVLAQLDM